MSGQVSQIKRLVDDIQRSKKKLLNTLFALVFTSKTINGQYKLKRSKNYTNETEAPAFRQYVHCHLIGLNAELNNYFDSGLGICTAFFDEGVAVNTYALKFNQSCSCKGVYCS